MPATARNPGCLAGGRGIVFYRGSLVPFLHRLDAKETLSPSRRSGHCARSPEGTVGLLLFSMTSTSSLSLSGSTILGEAVQVREAEGIGGAAEKNGGRHWLNGANQTAVLESRPDQNPANPVFPTPVPARPRTYPQRSVPIFVDFAGFHVQGNSQSQA